MCFYLAWWQIAHRFFCSCFNASLGVSSARVALPSTLSEDAVIVPLCIRFPRPSRDRLQLVLCVFSGGEYTPVFRDEQQFSKHGTGRAEGVCFEGRESGISAGQFAEGGMLSLLLFTLLLFLLVTFTLYSTLYC